MSAITDFLISGGEVSSVNVKSAPDILNFDTRVNKNYFDRYPDLIVEKLNGLVGYISDNFTDANIDTETLDYFENYLGWRPPNN